MNDDALYLTLAQVFPTLLIALGIELFGLARLASQWAEVFAAKVFASKDPDVIQRPTNIGSYRAAESAASNLPFVYLALGALFLAGESMCIVNVAVFAEPSPTLGWMTILCLLVMSLFAVVVPFAAFIVQERLESTVR